jgi:hypothetical protein
MTTEPEQFVQHLHTKKVYHVDHLHIDGSDLLTTAQPQWSMTHLDAAGNPTASIATLETSVDGFSARLTAHNMVGVVTITVTAPVGPTAMAIKTFQIAVVEHPPVTARSPTFKISQHRNEPIH